MHEKVEWQKMNVYCHIRQRKFRRYSGLQPTPRMNLSTLQSIHRLFSAFLAASVLCEKIGQPWSYPCVSVSSVVKQIMECRPHCGACCIAPSISSPIPGMPDGKRAGVRCVQLLPDMRCALFGKPERPAVCVSLRPTEEMCGASREEALAGLARLESETSS